MGCHKNVGEDDILEPKLLLNVICREMICLLSALEKRCSPSSMHRCIDEM